MNRLKIAAVLFAATTCFSANASAQLVTTLSPGNANCPFGGVSISVVTGLPNTVQTSYVCSAPQGAMAVRDANGDLVPEAIFNAQVYYWDSTSAAYWIANRVSGDVDDQYILASEFEPFYADSACATAPFYAGSIPGLAIAITGATGAPIYAVTRNELVMTPGTCYKRNESTGTCFSTGTCAAASYFELDTGVSLPSISYDGPLIFSQ